MNSSALQFGAPESSQITHAWSALMQMTEPAPAYVDAEFVPESDLALPPDRALQDIQQALSSHLAATTVNLAETGLLFAPKSC